MGKAYTVSKAGLVEGPNCAPFRVHDEFNHEDLCDMLNECHDYAIRLLDSRLHEVCLEREQARTERNYERRRYQDAEGVWLETRDANKALAERLRKTESHLKQLSHWCVQFVNELEKMPEFGPQPKYGNGLIGMMYREAEASERFMDRVTQRQSGNDAGNQEKREGSVAIDTPGANPQ